MKRHLSLIELLACRAKSGGPDPEPVRRRGQATMTFSLIELLVVVTVLAILAAILLPTLAKAKQRAVRVACLSNIKQCVVALHMRADDLEGSLPQISPNAHMPDYYEHSGYSLLTSMQDYLAFDLWQCANLPGPAVDSPANSAAEKRGSFSYFPGKGYMGTLYTDFQLRKNSAEDVIMGDDAYTWGGDALFRACHDQGTAFNPYSSNPSLRLLKMVSPGGANTGFNDGHVEWINGKDLTNVGHQGFSNCDIYSIDRN